MPRTAPYVECTGRWVHKKYIGETMDQEVLHCSDPACRELWVIDPWSRGHIFPPEATDLEILKHILARTCQGC